MLAPPSDPNPWDYVPKDNKTPGLQGVFVAWGWVRAFVNTAIPQAYDEFYNLAHLNAGEPL